MGLILSITGGDLIAFMLYKEHCVKSNVSGARVGAGTPVRTSLRFRQEG